MSLDLQGNSRGTLHKQGMAGVEAAVQILQAAAASAGECGGNLVLAEQLQSISRVTMAYRMSKFGIQAKEY